MDDFGAEYGYSLLLQNKKLRAFRPVFYTFWGAENPAEYRETKPALKEDAAHWIWKSQGMVAGRRCAPGVVRGIIPAIMLHQTC